MNRQDVSGPSHIRRLQGTADLLPTESARWVALEDSVRAVMSRYGFGEIRFPILEPTELFNRGTGSSTDIVQKEMYTLIDRGNRSLALRPEGTPSVVRAFLENNLAAQRPYWKLFYLGPMFRAERPQKGRYRQFHQYGAELLGAASPNADIEVIALARAILLELGVDRFRLVLNSIGSPPARARHNEALRTFLERDPARAGLCDDCRRRTVSNPLRVFDCKNKKCLEILRDAPTIDGFLTDEDRDHLECVKDGLVQVGIPYELDPRMVRGLDYYTRTAFEFKTDLLGAQDALCGGGRYDLLVETLGGPPAAAVGFAAGIERILAAMAVTGIDRGPMPRLDVFVCMLGEKARRMLPRVLGNIRRLGFSADADFLARGLKAQMKEANRLGARLALLIGGDELERGRLSLRHMDDGVQTEIPSDAEAWTSDLFKETVS